MTTEGMVFSIIDEKSPVIWVFIFPSSSDVFMMFAFMVEIFLFNEVFVFMRLIAISLIFIFVFCSSSIILFLRMLLLMVCFTIIPFRVEVITIMNINVIMLNVPRANLYRFLMFR